jgi:pimeloyl-ACP methyl ester carboxylesterase
VTTFQRDGLSLWFQEFGSGPAVILHTGGGGDSDMFVSAGYADALVEAGYRAILFDHRGHGRSAAPLRREQHLTVEYAADVVGLLDALNLPSAAIIGYSQGMQIACALAATHSERVAAVVGIGAVGAADDSPEWRTEAAAASRENGMKASMRAIAERESEPPPEWLIENLSSTDPEVFALLLEAQLDDENGLWDYFADVHAPTLLIVGEHEEDDDESGPGVAAQNARTAAQALRHGEAYVVPGLRHLAAFWRSDLTLPVILRFLRKSHPPENTAGG